MPIGINGKCIMGTNSGWLPFHASHVSHGEIEDLGDGMGICVMAFRDPDNIKIELTSPR